jgi:hypothetical protein|nr:MAG TPA: hypothetical protein [Caudoviricetes sp.]
MAFTVEVYEKETGICVDRINTTDIRSEIDWYKIYPVPTDCYQPPKEYRIEKYELTTRSFLENGKALMVKGRFDTKPLLFPNVYSYKKVDLHDGLEYLRVEYRPWGQDRIQAYMMAMSMIDFWEEQ